jgi:hypothetical protein
MLQVGAAGIEEKDDSNLTLYSITSYVFSQGAVNLVFFICYSVS